MEEIINKFLGNRDLGYYTPTVELYIKSHMENNSTDQIIDLLKPLVWLFMYEQKRLINE